MVLPLALLALVVIAAVVACAFASAYLEQRIGRNTLYAVQAAGAAEAGAAAVVGAWEAHGLSLLAPGREYGASDRGTSRVERLHAVRPPAQ